ncbi:cellulase glycosyl hydrolase family 5 protein [Nitzschia inconspicua]|uniref:Cellulase glycosyl hydrolase family 5 protein n=1 Tax=Nitzschia inconspicua TaxID=303405 RepID=A0A9K3PXW8_9STRA|nr:cellulase glycosyl hydrolase family 5 protein [Nitzschia inconspicua]
MSNKSAWALHWITAAVASMVILAKGVAGIEIPPGGTKYPHFIAMNETMTCVGDKHATPFNNQIRGVNLGGWMVLEPWITPSLFYQFLGKGGGEIAIDTYTFCEVLGPEEANRQLRRHWETWVTQEIIEELAHSGINALRLPVGDFMYKSYGPYDGCFDGALEYVDIMLDWAYSYGLVVLLDIHALKDSQNGFDNSGQAMGFKWTTAIKNEFTTDISFEHWPIRDARWIGTFDQENANYSSINFDNIQHSLDVIEIIVDKYKGHPAVHGLEPVNEPWQYTPIDVLKRFYWEGYLIVKRDAPYWKYIMHDSFRLDTNIWGGFMDGCPERAMDTHIYQAWRNPDSRIGYFQDACATKSAIGAMEREFGPVIVGEWSLATDNCAMWLNGFNDNLPGFPRLPCKYVPCSEPYMGNEQPGTPVDPTMPMQGPYGTGMSGPSFGLCPVGRDWVKESSGNPQTGRDWVRSPPKAPAYLDDTDNVMKHLANKKISSFSLVGHGFFFWNFRTDLDEPAWSYLLALKRGWIPTGSFNEPSIQDSCRNEDSMAYKCILKKNVPDENIIGAVEYILYRLNDTATTDDRNVESLKGKDLYDGAGDLITRFFESFKGEGITCDFGGIAMLVEENRNITDDDFLGWDDDEYLPRTKIVYKGPVAWQLTLIVLFGILIGALAGFVVGMHTNRGFNRFVRQSAFFRPISRSKNKLVRSSLALDALVSEHPQSSNEQARLLRNEKY